ncbi:MAG TPA: 2OG-Fe(II) oxygenase [Steroidobacteraceae bacterium]
MKNAFIVWDGAFTSAELDAFEAYGDRQVRQKATLAKGDADEDIRISRIAWLEPNGETSLLYERLTQITRKLNDDIYHFDITGLENVQYSVHHGNEAGHYHWHIDHGPHNLKRRKISMSIQLTDPSQYEGCDLQFQVSNTIGVAPRKRGTGIAFPSFLLHRVTPIISGTRKALVVWAVGPAFR